MRLTASLSIWANVLFAPVASSRGRRLENRIDLRAAVSNNDFIGYTLFDGSWTSLTCDYMVVLTKAGHWGCSGTSAVNPYTLPSGCAYLDGAYRIFVGQDGTLERTTKCNGYCYTGVIYSDAAMTGDARTGYACQTAFSSVTEFHLARVTSTVPAVSHSLTSSTTQSSATAQPPVNRESGGGSDSLSAGTMVGIVFGVIGALASAVGAWIGWKQYRKRNL